MFKKILITGGPVHAYLDSVKIITNSFKGGLMAKTTQQFITLAEHWDASVHIIYLCSKNTPFPQLDKSKNWRNAFLTVIHHNGLYDYMEKVLELAPNMDAVVLGAAVANLVPFDKIEGKFPSHNYKEGDKIPIDFTIAPRIIDRVKKIAPKTQLFGFKLLTGVPHEELISAAYCVLLESKAVAVFANDSNHLDTIYVVNKDRSVQTMTRDCIPSLILERLQDEYYETTHSNKHLPIERHEEINDIIKRFAPKFTMVENGILLGAVAKRCEDRNEFFVTGRGKHELDSISHVVAVNHQSRKIYTQGRTKASLNAPLLDYIFKTNLNVDHIVHYHEQYVGLPTLKYGVPGTSSDTDRDNNDISTSFNITGHGCMLLFDKEGKLQ